METIKTSIMAIGIFLLGTAPLLAQECATLQGASPDKLVSYLNRVADRRQNAPCVAFAIKKIGEQRYEPAIPVLTKFLEFRWPLGVNQKQRRFALEHDGFTIYPAADALEKIGKNSLPAVLRAMKANSTSRQEMEVAVSVWMTIYKDQTPMGVALLKQEADRTTQPMARQQLGWAAIRAAMGWCNSSEQTQCDAAAQTNFSSGMLPHASAIRQPETRETK
ncbi:MAG TPA: hypothetical protein VGV15_04340 [Terriglobales bacterium]|nr:hypothetical protein [Terriglobales bacterium]